MNEIYIFGNGSTEYVGPKGGPLDPKARQAQRKHNYEMSVMAERQALGVQCFETVSNQSNKTKG